MYEKEQNSQIVICCKLESLKEKISIHSEWPENPTYISGSRNNVVISDCFMEYMIDLADQQR